MLDGTCGVQATPLPAIMECAQATTPIERQQGAPRAWMIDVDSCKQA